MRKKPLVFGGVLGFGALAVGGAVVVGLALVVGAPVLLRGRVVDFVERELDRQLGATVRFDDVSVSILPHFPDVTVGLTGLKVTGEGPFEGIELASVADAAVTLDLMSVVRGRAVVVEGIEVVGPRIHVVVDAEGRSNLDTLPDTEADEAAGEAGAYNLRLRAYAIRDLSLVYEDVPSRRRIELKDLDHEGKAALTSRVAAVETRTDIVGLTVVDGGTTMLRDVTVGWDLDADLDQRTGELTLKDNRLALNDLVLSATGKVGAGDSTTVDLSFEALETSFKSLLSLVPAVYSDGFDEMVGGGTLALTGKVAGTIDPSGATWPAFTVDLDVANGSFRYPDLPAAVDDVQLDVHLAHPGGDPDALVVDLKRFRLAVDKHPVEGHLSLKHPMTDPDVDVALKGKVDLARLGAALPPSPGVTYRGVVDADFAVKGKLSAFEAQNIDAVDATGTVRLTDVVYTDPEVAAVPVRVDRMLVTVDPRRIDLTDVELRLGKSDLAGTAQLDNLLSYLLADDTLVGRATMTSSRLNLDAILGTDADEEAGAAAEEEASSIYVVPKDLDLALALDLDRVRYGGRTYEAVKGRVAAKDGALRMDDLGMRLLGARVMMNGLYRAETEQFADVEVTLDVKDLGLEGAIQSFETLRRMAPIAEKSKGKLNTDLTAKLRLSSDLTPEISSLFSNGDILLLGVVLQPGVMKDVAQKVKSGKFDKIDLHNTGLSYKIENGRTTLRETKVKVGGVPGTLGGSVGTLDQTLDLRLKFDVPVGDVGAKDLLGGVTRGDVPVVVKIGGTMTDPKVKVDLGKAADAVVDDVKAVVGEEVDAALAAAQAKADAILAEARKAADKLVAEAKVKADDLRKVAKKEAKKLVDQAKNPVSKKLAEEAGDKLIAEADKAAKRLESEAKKAADQLLATAKTKADAALAEAGGQAKSRLK